MTERNRDRLSIKEDPQASWTFAVPAIATTCSGATDEIGSICSAVFDAFEDYLLPLEIRYKAALFEADGTLADVYRAWDPVEIVERTVQNESGIDVQQFLESTSELNDGTALLRRVEFDRLRVNAALADGRRYVDRSTGTRLVRGSVPREREPDFDPIRISVRQTVNHDEADIDAPFLYYVTVEVYTDVVFFDSAVASENRTYLGAFLDRVAQSVTVEAVHREPDSTAVREVH